MATSNPIFSFFPALPLSKTLRLGEWCVGNPRADLAWRSRRFKELALAHLEMFEKLGFKHGALMWHHDRGFDGSMPAENEWAAIRATICFASIDANDHVRDDPNAARYLSTSENAELFSQPIDEEKAYISYQTGGVLRRVLSGGWKIGEPNATPHLPDAVVPIDHPVIPSQLQATALFNALLTPQTDADRRIAVALEWHRFALSNPRAITLSQRLIALKTGFEALSGQSKTHRCGAFLRRLFEDVTRPHVRLLPWAGLLWSPTERTDLQRSWIRDGVPQPVVRSELEDWFATLGSARNEIIHQGTLSTIEYPPPTERPLSRYVGTLFWTADRLLRETVKAMLGANVLLSGRFKDEELHAKVGAWIRARRQAAQEEAAAPDPEPHPPSSAEEVDLGPEAEEVETASPEDDDFDAEGDDHVQPAGEIGGRDLAGLLVALNCDAANKVRLARTSADFSRATKGGAVPARTWGASFAKNTITVDEREKDLLHSAGAEFPLPRGWTRAE